MALKLGTIDISKAYIGSTEVTKSYLGDTEVFGTTPPFHLNAIDFNGTNEYMLNSTNQAIGIVNDFSVGMFFETDGSVSNARVQLDSPANPNKNAVWLLINSGKVYVAVIAPDGAANKQYQGNTTLSANTKYFVGLTWDGTNLEVVLNGVHDTPYVKNVDNFVTMTDTNRNVQMNVNRNLTVYGPAIISSVYMWNISLPVSALTAIYDSGNGYQHDMRNSLGNYTQTANLKHQWALGKETGTNIGKDYVSSGNINVSDNSANVTDADIVTF